MCSEALKLMSNFCRWSSPLLYFSLLYFAKKNVLCYTWNWWDIFAVAYLYFAVLMGDWTPRGSWSWPSRFWLRNLSPPSFDTNIKNSITPKFPGFMSYWATEIEGKSRMKNIPARDTLFNIMCICSAARRLIIFYLPAMTMRHLLKDRKHTGLAKLVSSLQAYAKDQGPQRIARLILHHNL